MNWDSTCYSVKRSYLETLSQNNVLRHCQGQYPGQSDPGHEYRFSTNPADYSITDIIERDVAIIGGGSSGAYTAVRLCDFNKSVVVVERKETLGGHAETYTNPFTGYTTDIGVVVFHHLPVVLDYFSRFDVPLVEIPSISTNLTYIDFTTGQEVDFKPPTPSAFITALRTYLSHLDKYKYLDNGFNITYPVDPDLLISFKCFVEKYGLQDLVSQTFAVNQGYVPILDISMIYIFKYLNANQVNDYLSGSTLTTAQHNIQGLYKRVASFLGTDALLDSKVLAMERQSFDRELKPDSSPIRILVQTSTGRKLIIAKAMVCAIPPMLEGLTGFDLSKDEVTLFRRFSANGYYTGLLNNTGLKESISATGPGQDYNVPILPGIYSMSVTPEGLTQVYYGSPSVLPESEVKTEILSTLKRVQQARGILTSGVEPDWLAFSSHSPFNLMISNDEIRGGFYKNLEGLQGRRNTFYHGAAWDSQDSSQLWKLTDEYLLPKILRLV
ncbi:amine oxidase, flavin-containing superfamily [Nemania sp. FL0031]|nr:amine oxidase, flavin-containing superfamily [Nemania sp. FL0031]